MFSSGLCHLLLFSVAIVIHHCFLPVGASFIVQLWSKRSSAQAFTFSARTQLFMSAKPTPETTTMQNTSTATNTNTASTPTKPQQTFYQRPLPASCTALSSKKGKGIFASALSSNGLKSFFALIQQL
jgi:hypothetical protein